MMMITNLCLVFALIMGVIKAEVLSTSEITGANRQLGSSSYLSGFFLRDIYSDSSCGATSDSTPVRTVGFSFNVCMPKNAYASTNGGSSSSANVEWVMYTSDMSCASITQTVYKWTASTGCASEDSTCCTGCAAAGSSTCTVQTGEVVSGGLCSGSNTDDDSVPSGYSQYTYCDFSSPLPNLAYSSVVQSLYTLKADTDGCTGQPPKITAYPTSTCIETGTATSQQYICNANDDGDTATFYSYRNGGCSGQAYAVSLNSLCQSSAYTDDDQASGTSYTGMQNVQYSCQGVSDDDDILTSGAIAGIVIACFVFFICIVGGCMLLSAKKPVQLDEDQVPLNHH